MRNWKTTASALLSAAASFVLFSHSLDLIVWPPWILALGLFASVGGLAAFGIAAKDFDVSGVMKR